MAKRRSKKPETRGRPRKFDTTINLKVTMEWIRTIDLAAEKMQIERSDFLRRAAETAARRRLRAALPTVNTIMVGNPYRRFTNYDCAPFGYQYVPDDARSKELQQPVYRLVENPDEQNTIKRIIQLHNQDASLLQIADTLTRAGVTSRTGTALTATVISRVIQRAEVDLQL